MVLMWVNKSLITLLRLGRRRVLRPDTQPPFTTRERSWLMLRMPVRKTVFFEVMNIELTPGTSMQVLGIRSGSWRVRSAANSVMRGIHCLAWDLVLLGSLAGLQGDCSG